MRCVAFFFLFISTSVALADRDIANACEKMKESAEELTDQAPIKVDYMTSLIGVTAILFNNKCELTYASVVKESVFLQSHIEQLASVDIEVTEQDLIAFYNSERGRAEYVKNFKKNVMGDQSIAYLLSVPFFRVYYRVSFDRANINAIEIDVN